jgi:hypothetical protein
MTIRTMIVPALLIAAVSTQLANPQTSPAAPVPSQISSAKRVFVSNAGVDYPWASYIKDCTGSPDGFYNEFYTALKNWDRYELSQVPGDADLIFQIRVAAPSRGGSDPELKLKISDPKTHAILWTLSQGLPVAGREASRRKNFGKALGTLLDNVKKISAQTAS